MGDISVSVVHEKLVVPGALAGGWDEWLDDIDAATLYEGATVGNGDPHPDD